MGSSVQLIVDDSLRANDAGYEFLVRLNWYRSMPLSCVEKVSVALDGAAVDAKDIRFGINGHEYSLDEMAELVGEYWFVQDYAALIVRQPRKVARAEKHSIEAEIFLRAPYIPVGPGKFLTMPTKSTAIQVSA